MTDSSSVIHIIPYDGIGGVEVVVRSIPSGFYNGIRFQKAFLACRKEAPSLRQGDYAGMLQSENSPRNFFMLLRWLGKREPELLVASLWRCYLILILHKLSFPRSLCVCFLHLPHSVHALDAILSWFAMLLATEIWADSQATLQCRVPAYWRRKAVTVSLLPDRLLPVTQLQPKAHFVFWGRLSRQKNLPKALEIIHELASFIPNISFWIIGPDGGEQESLHSLVHHMSLESIVAFVGPKSADAISKYAQSCSFYLQTSSSEGMALSVVEAMQLGLVPVVSPVGEIANYCHDGLNALFAGAPRATALRIAALLGDHVRYQQLRQHAIDTWVHPPLYREDFLNRVRKLL